MGGGSIPIQNVELNLSNSEAINLHCEDAYRRKEEEEEEEEQETCEDWCCSQHSQNLGLECGIRRVEEVEGFMNNLANMT